MILLLLVPPALILLLLCDHHFFARPIVAFLLCLPARCLAALLSRHLPRCLTVSVATLLHHSANHWLLPGRLAAAELPLLATTQPRFLSPHPPHTFLLLIFCACHYAAQLIVAVLPRSPPRCFAALLHHCLVRRITGCSIAASLLQNCPAATASCHTASLRLSDPILSLAALLCPSTGCHLAASLPPFFCQIVALVV